ncbi:hypothetical protein AYO38_00020 [bacterium SCGC AG-212-C10]|nr:hypothetical protein AYO38_00020 [bacterium SCGC AG-212-C10]
MPSTGIVLAISLVAVLVATVITRIFDLPGPYYFSIAVVTWVALTLAVPRVMPKMGREPEPAKQAGKSKRKR